MLFEAVELQRSFPEWTLIKKVSLQPLLVANLLKL